MKTDTKNFLFRTIRSQFGKIGVVWYKEPPSIKIIRIVLSKPSDNFHSVINTLFPCAEVSNSIEIIRLCNDISEFLKGNHVNFNLRFLDRSQLKDFQKKVILLERKIPRGQISTYGRLALKLGFPRAARGVGQALANNPFPIIIPCHRTIRSDGSLGGYIGGLDMKRRLLEFEGIKFDQKDHIIAADFW